MKPINVKIKRLNDKAVIPTYAHNGDAGLDLVATSCHIDSDNNAVYGTGIAVEIPKGYMGLVFPRSSNAKKDLLLSNSVGVIDSTYRGEILAKFRISRSTLTKFFIPKFWWQRIFAKNYEQVTETEYSDNIYKVGDRIAQLIIIPYPKVNIIESEELSESERGQGGYGSTGK